MAVMDHCRASSRIPASAVVFDLGGVLIDWDPRHLYRTIFRGDEAAWRRSSHGLHPEWNARQDAGRPWAEAIASLVRSSGGARAHRRLPQRWPETLAARSRDRWRSSASCGRGACRLRAQKLVRRDVPRRRARYPFSPVRRHRRVGEERLAKPDPRLFRVLFDRHGLDPRATVFVDDTDRNLAVAGELGMVVLPFRGATRLRADLERLGLLGSAAPASTAGVAGD